MLPNVQYSVSAQPESKQDLDNKTGSSSLQSERVLSIDIPSETEQSTPMSRLFAALVDLYIANENLAIQVALNFWRDFAWTWWSCENLNDAGQPTEDTNYDLSSQWFGQQVWGTISIVCCLLGLMALYKYKKREFPLADAVIYGVAASAAIYTWDYGQGLGINLGQNNLGLSALNAGYFASIFTGGFEGPTQYLVITAGGMLKDREIRKKYFSNPLRLVGEFGLASSIGAIPGGDWQVVFVADTVATWNVVTTKIIEKIIAKAEKFFQPRERPPEIIEMTSIVTEPAIEMKPLTNVKTKDAKSISTTEATLFHPRRIMIIPRQSTMRLIAQLKGEEEDIHGFTTKGPIRVN